jgi:toxin secretion/phage lysis holin
MKQLRKPETMSEKITLIGQAILSYAWSWIASAPATLGLLGLFMVADFFAGCASALKRGEPIFGDKMTSGVRTKVVVILLCLIAHPIEHLAQEIGVPIELQLEKWIPAFFALGELASILRNANDAGVRLPPFLVKWVIEGRSKFMAPLTAEERAQLEDSTNAN